MLRKWIWRDFANIALGCWLIASAVTPGHHSQAVVWNDLACGGLIAVCGLVTLRTQFLNAVDLQHVPWNLAVSAGLGVWLMSARGVRRFR